MSMHNRHHILVNMYEYSVISLTVPVDFFLTGMYSLIRMLQIDILRHGILIKSRKKA